MSFITPATMQEIAHSLDIPQLSDEAARALAPDVEYRLREVIQVSAGGQWGWRRPAHRAGGSCSERCGELCGRSVVRCAGALPSPRRP